MKKVICIIPARGGSKSIPLKNIKLFLGKPLIYWTLKAAQETSFIKDIYVPTDSLKIKKTVENMKFSKVKVTQRSKKSSTNKASSEEVLLELAQNKNFDDLIFLQATSPFTTSQDIKKAYKNYSQQKLNSLFSSVPWPRFIWKANDSIMKPINFNYKKRPRRQDFNNYHMENGAFYITSRKNLMKSKNRLSGKIGTYVMKQESFIELDHPKDWKIAELLFNQLSKNEATHSGFPLNRHCECNEAIPSPKVMRSPRVLVRTLAMTRTHESDRNKTLCFDIDGVICTNTWGKYKEAQPNTKIIKHINALHKKGHTIILHTARGTVTKIDWKKLTAHQMKKWGVKYHTLIMGKPQADIYIDDKATNITDWLGED